MKIKINKIAKPWFITSKSTDSVIIMHPYLNDAQSINYIRALLAKNKTVYTICNVSQNKIFAYTKNKKIVPCAVFIPKNKEEAINYTYRCKITPKLFISGVLIKYIYYNTRWYE